MPMVGEGASMLSPVYWQLNKERRRLYVKLYFRGSLPELPWWKGSTQQSEIVCETQVAQLLQTLSSLTAEHAIFKTIGI
jgi:hypothetical protein